jgi:hypothetical protein
MGKGYQIGSSPQKTQLDEHAMVALFDLMGQIGETEDYLFRLNSAYRTKHKKASSHAHASAIDIRSTSNEHRALLDFFFEDYEIAPNQGTKNFNAHDHVYTLTPHGKAFLEKHNMRILDERGRPGAPHFHIDFYNPGHENVDLDKTYKFHDAHKGFVSGGGGFNSVSYGNAWKTYKDNGYQDTQEYKNILASIEPDKVEDPHGHGFVYNIGKDSTFYNDTIPNRKNIWKSVTNNEAPIINEPNENIENNQEIPTIDGRLSLKNFRDKDSHGFKISELKQNVERLDGLAWNVHEFSEEEQADLKKQIHTHTKKFHRWLEGEIDLDVLKDDYRGTDDDDNRRLYLKYLQEHITIDADGYGTMKTLKELSNANVGEVSKKRGFVKYLHQLTDGEEYAENITDTQDAWWWNESKLENLFEDSNWVPNLMMTNLEIPLEGRISKDVYENYMQDPNFKNYLFKHSTPPGAGAGWGDTIPDQYSLYMGKTPTGVIITSAGNVNAQKGKGGYANIMTQHHVARYNEDPNLLINTILNKYIRNNDLDDENYTNDKASDTANDIIAKEDEEANKRYQEYVKVVNEKEKNITTKSKPKEGTADPQEIYNYLTTEKGLSHIHAMGMLANIAGESTFKIGAIGDGGTSGGLFQHHNSSNAEPGEGRFDRMKKHVGDDWATDWKGQIDYTLDVEKDSGLLSYLEQNFETEEDATFHFMKHFERPADQSRENSDERYQKLVTNFGSSDDFKGGSVVSTEVTETAQWENPLSDKKDLVSRISVSSTEEGLARILKDNEEITGRDGAITVKGIRAEGNKLIVEANVPILGDKDTDFGHFEMKNGQYVFVPGEGYEMFQSSDAVTQEDRDIFDAFIFGVQNDTRFANGVLDVVKGGEGSVTGGQLYDTLDTAPDGWSPEVTVSSEEKAEGFYATGKDGTVYWNTVDPNDPNKRIVTAFGSEEEYFAHRKANGFKEDWSNTNAVVEGSEYESLYNDARTKKRNEEDGIISSEDAKDNNKNNHDNNQDEKFNQEADNAITMLKVAGGVAGMGLAMKTLPIGDAPELGANFKAYMNKLEHLAESGLSAEEMASAKNDLSEAYHIGAKNVLRASGGSRGTFLANMGMLNANRVNGLIKLSALDQTVKRQNLQQLGQGLKLQETMNNRSGEISRKMEYEEELRKSNIQGAIGSSLIGSALQDLAYAHSKRDNQNLNSLMEDNIWLKTVGHLFESDSKEDVQVVDHTQKDNKKPGE